MTTCMRTQGNPIYNRANNNISQKKLVTLLRETHEVPSVHEALTASAMKKKKIEQQASTQGQQLWMPLRWEPKISLKQKGGPVSHQML